MAEGGRGRLGVAEARERLAVERGEDGDVVHTFRQGGIAIIGADWPLTRALHHMEEHGVEEAGPGARGMDHGLVTIDDQGPIFWATAAEGPQS